MNSNRNLRLVKFPVLALLTACFGASLANAQAFGPCSEKTLTGDYGFTITGQILAGPAAGPVTGVAMTHFDGQGNLNQVDHVVLNGVPPSVEWRPATGTYTVNANCTGAAEIDFTDGSPPLHLHFVLAKRGNEIRDVVSNPGTAVTAIGSKLESFF